MNSAPSLRQSYTEISAFLSFFKAVSAVEVTAMRVTSVNFYLPDVAANKQILLEIFCKQ